MKISYKKVRNCSILVCDTPDHNKANDWYLTETTKLLTKTNGPNSVAP